jgi:hypothetical protein
MVREIALHAVSPSRIPPYTVQASLPKRFRSPVRPLGFAKPTHQGKSRELPLQRLAFFVLPNGESAKSGGYLSRMGVPKNARLSYSRVTHRFFAISGIFGDRIFYNRCNFSGYSRSVKCVHLEYPSAEKRAWDKIVTRISCLIEAVAAAWVTDSRWSIRHIWSATIFAKASVLGSVKRGFLARNS